MLEVAEILECGNDFSASDVNGDALLVKMSDLEVGGRFESVDVVPIYPLHAFAPASWST
jgi:hypothetical protein